MNTAASITPRDLLHRAALRRPCRTLRDQRDHIHLQWLRAEATGMIASVILTIDLAWPGSRLRLPADLGTVDGTDQAWHASVGLHDAPALDAAGKPAPGAVQGRYMVPLREYSPVMEYRALKLCHGLLGGLGTGGVVICRSSHTIHGFKRLGGLERSIAFGRVD